MNAAETPTGAATAAPPPNHRSATGPAITDGGDEGLQDGLSSQAGLEAWKGLGGDETRNTVTIYSVNESGGSEYLLTVEASQSHESVLSMLRTKYGPGQYRFQPRENGRIGKSFVMGIAADPRQPVAGAAPAPTMPAGPQAPDLRGLVDGFTGAVKEMMSGMLGMIDKRDQAAALERREAALAAKEQQLEVIRELGKSRGDGGGQLNTILNTLVERALQPPAPPPDPFAQLERLMKVKKLVGNDGSEENPFVEVAKGLGPVLAGLIAQAQGGQRPAVAAVRRVAPANTAPAIPAPSPVVSGDGAAEPVAPSAGDAFQQLIEVIQRMAAKGTDPASAIVALQALLEPDEFEQLTALLTLPNALDQLAVIAPQLTPYRAWIDAVAATITGQGEGHDATVQA